MNSRINKFNLLFSFIIFSLPMMLQTAGAQTSQALKQEATPKPQEIVNVVKKKSIGKLILSKGIVTSRSPEQSLFTLSKGSDVYLMDTVTTANKSFAVIRFNDGSKTTIRPNTELILSEFSQESGKERKTIELIKGGLRSITGAIGKARPKNVQYRARNLTIGIRGTVFVLVVCQGTVCDTSGEQAAQQLLEDSKLKPLDDIFVNNKKTGLREKINRKEFRESLSGIYLSVQDGAVRLESEDFYIEMPAGESCLAASGGLECFKQGLGLEDMDQYLNGNLDQLFVLDLRNDVGVDPEDESLICEIF
jgi:hypothetical protein